jgi:hypothetical protein
LRGRDHRVYGAGTVGPDGSNWEGGLNAPPPHVVSGPCACLARASLLHCASLVRVCVCRWLFLCLFVSVSFDAASTQLPVLSQAVPKHHMGQANWNATPL